MVFGNVTKYVGKSKTLLDSRKDAMQEKLSARKILCKKNCPQQRILMPINLLVYYLEAIQLLQENHLWSRK